jgi:nucleoside-diphosphate-sugar epimerase
MSILITGGIGAIGSNVARQFLEAGDTVVIYDRVEPRPDNKIIGGFGDKLIAEVGNVTDGPSIFDIITRRKVDGILHFVGMLPPHQNNLRPLEALNVNIMGTAHILEAARILGVGPVIVASAAGVMGRPKDLATPRKEEDVILPLAGIYPLSKLAAEQLVYTYRQLHKVNTTAIRPRNVYGPGANFRIQPLFEMFFAALEGKDFVRKAGGDSIFDYTYVKDIAKGIVQLYNTKAPPYYVYNISRGRSTSMAEVAAAMQKVFPKQKFEVGPGSWEGVVEGGKEFELTVHPAVMPPQDVSRAKNDFGYQPEWDIERGLADWLRWHRTGKY